MAEKGRGRVSALVVGMEAIARDKAFNWLGGAQPTLTEGESTAERFKSLELDLLLSEFRSVAEEKEKGSIEEEEREPEEPTSTAEAQWLHQVGLDTLVEKAIEGTAISEAELKEETAGFTPLQIDAVRQRVNTLSATLKKRSKAGKGDARELFTQAPEPSASPALDPEAAQRLSVLTDSVEEPPTNFFDLGEEDQQQMQCLSLIQVTSILETCLKHSPLGPKLKKVKKVKRGEDSRTFGTKLELLVARDVGLVRHKMADRNIPLIFSCLISFLRERGMKEEGIFRKAGAAARIKSLRAVCEENKGDVDLAALDVQPHDASDLLKQFLRELPEPLLTDEYVEAFMLVPRLQPASQQIYVLQLLLMLLPNAHRACLRMLVDFLCAVSTEQSVNKMSVSNLAVVFAPTLFYVRGSKGERMLKDIELQVSSAATLKIMMDHWSELWNVPPDIIAQARYVNEQRTSGRKASRPKDMKRLLSGKKLVVRPEDVAAAKMRVRWVDKSPENPPVRAVVTVTLGVADMDVNVTDATTAADILQAVGAEAGTVLNECGGNIGTRRLHKDTRILALLLINAGCMLVAGPTNVVVAGPA